MLKTLRRIIREEVRAPVREELEPLHKRLDVIERWLDGLANAIVFMAEQFPGTMPGKESHVVAGVKKHLRPTSQSL